MKKHYLLTALLLANATLPRGEGEGTSQTSPSNSGGNDGRLTEAEWQARAQAKHAQDSHADLVKRVATLEREKAALEASQIPQSGRALTKTEAAAYDAYVALGKPDEVKAKLTERDTYATYGTPDEVKSKIESGERATTTLAERDRTDAIRTAAGVVQFKDTVLSDRLAADKLELLPLEKVVRDGQEVQVAYVKDAAGVKHELGDYAKQKWNDYLPALQVAAATTTTTTPAFTRQDATTTSGSAGGGSWVQKAIAATGGGGAYKDPLQHGK